MYAIEKLDEKNYDSWAIQMKSVLIHMDLWDLVSGVSAKPDDVAEQGAWAIKDGKALATITLGVKPSQVLLIKHCNTSLEAWKVLSETHQPRDPARKVTLFKRLLTLPVGENDVFKYVNTFMETVEQLASIGVSVTDEILAIILLSNLPGSFESFVVAMESRDSLPSLATIRVKLLEESERRKFKGAEADGASEQAFMVRKDEKERQNNKRQKGSKNVQCFKCGKNGHFAAKCKEKKGKPTAFASLAASDTGTISKGAWYLDSGATSHMSCGKHFFVSFKDHKEDVMLAGEYTLEAKGIGDVELNTTYETILLKNVLYVPGLNANFVSLGKTTKAGLKVEFDEETAKIKAKSGKIVAKAVCKNDLYIFSLAETKCCAMYGSKENTLTWHNRYGHINLSSLKDMAVKNMVHGLDLKNAVNDIDCVTCLKSKICVSKFPSESNNRSQEILQLIHSDVCGPMNVDSIGGSRYFVTFIDDKSRFMMVFFMKHKNEVLESFKEYKALVERQTSKKIKTIRSDNGTEYVNGEFNAFLSKHGIQRQLTVPHTPQQNGVSERANRTLVEMARCMLNYSGLRESFWAEAVGTAAYLRNRAPTKSLTDVTPYEMWTGKKPSVQHFKIFGSPAIALDKTEKRKFRPKGKEYIFVGYSSTSKAYRLFDPIKQKIICSRDVAFIEIPNKNLEMQHTNDFILLEDEMLGNHNNDISAGEKDQIPLETDAGAGGNADMDDASDRGGDNSVEAGDNVHAEKIGRGRPKIIRTGKPGRPRKQFNVINLLDVDINVPQSVQEAVNGPQADQWIEAMDKEYAALVENGTFELTDLPKGQKAIGSKWVYALKRDKDGCIERFKARLVAKGCAQQYGVNYTETFSPVIRYSSIRMLIAIAVEHELYMHQMDVSTAYLNGDLHEEVYMHQPEGFKDPDNPKKVLQLKKSLYGLKQSGREWNAKLDSVLRQMGFSACPSEPCLYVKNFSNRLNYVAVYVDDLIIACTDKGDLNDIKAQIGNNFKVADKGQLSHFLGIEIEREGETGSVKLGHKQYIQNLLKEFNLERCRTAKTPLDVGFQVNCNREDCSKVDCGAYQSLIGSLMYLALTTRPDIMHSVCKLAIVQKPIFLNFFNRSVFKIIRFVVHLSMTSCIRIGHTLYICNKTFS